MTAVAVNAVVRTVRNLALALTAGAEIVEQASGVPTVVDTWAVGIALACHVIAATIDRFQEEAKASSP
jgi:hypothetical protein